MATIINGRVCINGVELPPAPGADKHCSVTIINNGVFINGYQWKDGRWKRTLRALWHLLF